MKNMWKNRGIILLISFVLLMVGCADAGKDQNVVSSTTITLDGNASKADFAGEIKKYRWKQTEGKKVKLSDKKTINPTFIAPVVTEETVLTFRLTTVEKGGFHSPWRTRDAVSIYVSPSTTNLVGPMAVAAVNNASIKYGESVTFDANSSSDSDGQIVTYEWKDENNLTLSNEVLFDHIFDTVGNHTIILTITDNDGLTSTDEVIVTIAELQAPIARITSNVDRVLVGESITFDANTSSDADGEIISYQWLDETNTTLSNQKNFTYPFTTSGEHAITLIVMDDDAQEGRSSINIVVEAQLASISLDSSSNALEINATTTLSATGHYNDNTSLDVTSNVEWIIGDGSLVTVDVNGVLTALKSGTTTIQAKIDEILSNTVSMEVKTPISLESITVSPDPITIRVGENVQINVMGSYSDGTTKVVEDADYTVDDTNIITVDGTGTLDALAEGSTTLRVNAGTVYSSLVFVTVGQELNTTNFNFTNFGNTYTNQIPVDATLAQYDEKRFCMIAGQILSEDGSPLSGVKVSIHKHDEYGSTLTDSNGTYVIPAEGGITLTMRYTKNGYTTIDRKVYAPVQDWVRSPDVTMLAVDSKVTQVDFTNQTSQIHVSTPVVDDRGSRSTTLVFDGVSRATVKASDGSVRILTDIAVRATEFKTPASMPSDLPKESAFTYCSDLQIDGVSDDENVTFDSPVVMYVDNFLGFEVGEIVPVGYYDRNAGAWKASDNGAVVKLLDTNNDGVVDALDSTGDDLPNDLDGDGSVTDEVAGIQDNPNYVAGRTYWRAEMMHFTPWDHNWPYGPPADAEEPDQEDPKTDEEPKNDCQRSVSSYVTQKSRVFHEDNPVAGTDITLHYSSKRVQGYNHTIDASIDTSSTPASVEGAKVTLSVAGRTFTKTPDIRELNSLSFTWDGRDALGQIVSGEVKATIKVSYIYQVVYLRGSSSFVSAWAQVGGSTTGVRGRNTIEVSNSKTIKLNIQKTNDKNSIANGWSIDERAYLNILSNGTIQSLEGKKYLEQKNGLLFVVDTEPEKRFGFFPITQNRYYTLGLSYPSAGLSYSGNKVYLKSFTYENGSISNYESILLGTFSEFDFALSYSDRPINGYDVYAYYRGTIYEGLSDRSYFDASQSIVELKEKVRTRDIDNNPYKFATNSSGGNLNRNDNYWTIFGASSHLINKLDEIYGLDTLIDLSSIPEYQSMGITNEDIVVFKGSTGYVFNKNGLLTKIFNNTEKIVTKKYTYDVNGYVVTITNQFGEVTTITRDTEVNPTQITAPNGQVTTLIVDENGDLIEVKYEDNSKYSFSYFDGSLMDIMTDPNGNQIQHFFDENGRIIEEVDGEGGSYQFLRNVSGTETFYSTILPEGEISRSQDITLANGDTQSLMTLPTGETLTATFALDEKSTSSTRDGVTTAYIYTSDTLTHQKIPASKEITQPSGIKNTVTYTTSYDGNETHTNSKTQNITTNSKTTTLVTDYNNGTSTLAIPTGRTLTSTYDVNTRLTTKSTIGTLTPITYTYDTKGRVTSESTGTRTVSYTYDGRGNLTSVTDPRGDITSYSYDIVDNMITVSYPNGTTEHFSYDNNGNLLTKTVPTPANHTFVYNGTDSRINYTSPLQKATTYSYDKSKNVTAIIKPSGKTITNSYDKGRLVSTTTPEGTTNYSYLFADKVGSITQGSENITFTYDGTLLTSMAQSGVLSHTSNYTYNNDFQVTSTTYAGATENYSYDNDGLLLTSGAYTLTRDAQNAYTTQVIDGTLTQNRNYNTFGEIIQVSDNTFTYNLSQRDNAGAITQKQETLNGTTITYDYTFDEMGRLTQVQKDNNIAETYTYDNNGNRSTSTVQGTSITASYTQDDQLVVYGDNTYRYDEDGYLEEKVTPEGRTTYRYGTRGELLEVTTPTQYISYKHNSDNQRVAKLVDGNIVEKYLWANLTTLLAIYDANDNLVQRFEYADQRMPLSMIQNNTRYYLHYDQVGSLRVITDISHNTIKEITYDTYGKELSDSNEAFKVAFRFAGGLYDSDTKLIRFGYRDYDAETGKWTAKDPIDFEGGDSNLYGYVLGDPVNFVDPTGKVAWILYPLGAYLLYDTISDWADYLNKSNDLCEANTPIRTPEDYLKYRERVQQQLENSREIGKETTLDILKAGYPIAAPIDTAISAGYEFGK